MDLTQDVNMVRDGTGRMLGMFINMQLMFPIALTRSFLRGPVQHYHDLGVVLQEPCQPRMRHSAC